MCDIDLLSKICQNVVPNFVFDSILVIWKNISAVFPRTQLKKWSFPVKDFFSKCEEMKKSLMENFFFFVQWNVLWDGVQKLKIYCLWIFIFSGVISSTGFHCHCTRRETTEDKLRVTRHAQIFTLFCLLGTWVILILSPALRISFHRLMSSNEV